MMSRHCAIVMTTTAGFRPLPATPPACRSECHSASAIERQHSSALANNWRSMPSAKNGETFSNMNVSLRRSRHAARPPDRSRRRCEPETAGAGDRRSSLPPERAPRSRRTAPGCDAESRLAFRNSDRDSVRPGRRSSPRGPRKVRSAAAQRRLRRLPEIERIKLERTGLLGSRARCGYGECAPGQLADNVDWNLNEGQVPLHAARQPGPEPVVLSIFGSGSEEIRKSRQKGARVVGHDCGCDLHIAIGASAAGRELANPNASSVLGK